MVDDILEVLESALKLPAVDSLGSLVGVLEGNTEVRAAGAGGLGGFDLCRGVADLCEENNALVEFNMGDRNSHHLDGCCGDASGLVCRECSIAEWY